MRPTTGAVVNRIRDLPRTDRLNWLHANATIKLTLKRANMKSFPIAIVLLLLSSIGEIVHAQSGKTREQARPELAEAVSSGSLLSAGESGLMLREIYPHRYPATQAGSGKTRAQLRVETAEAVRQGDVAAGESGLTLREQNPGHYPPTAVLAAQTREQVQAELRAAIRSGDLPAAVESGLTLREQSPQWYTKSRIAQREMAQLQSSMAGKNP